MRNVRMTLALGLALLAVAVGLTLLHSPLSVGGTNGISPDTQTAIATTERSASYCQAREVLPRHTSAIRVSLVAAIGPRIRIAASSGGHTLTSGELGSGWTGESVAVPVRPLPRALGAATVCVSFRLRDGTIYVLGQSTARALAAREGARVLAGRMRIEYLRPRASSWASLVPSVIRNMGFGHAIGGIWVTLLALALVAAVTILTASVVLKDLP